MQPGLSGGSVGTDQNLTDQLDQIQTLDQTSLNESQQIWSEMSSINQDLYSIQNNELGAEESFQPAGMNDYMPSSYQSTPSYSEPYTNTYNSINTDSMSPYENGLIPYYSTVGSVSETPESGTIGAINGGNGGNTGNTTGNTTANTLNSPEYDQTLAQFEQQQNQEIQMAQKLSSTMTPSIMGGIAGMALPMAGMLSFLL